MDNQAERDIYHKIGRLKQLRSKAARQLSKKQLDCFVTDVPRNDADTLVSPHRGETVVLSEVRALEQRESGFYQYRVGLVNPTYNNNFADARNDVTNLFPHSPITLFPSKKNSAFTLAEVLITLGIIGVVAALTMPSLINKYRDQQTVAKLKKVYSIMQQATTAAVSEYGTVENWGTDSFVNSWGNF